MRKNKIRTISKPFLVIPVLILIFTACASKKTDPVRQEVKTTVFNLDGDSLVLKYDNQAGTCKLVHNGDTLLLHQDTTASGIRYSNKQYLYTEWHGEITLKKGKDIVFTNKK
ncbi:MliC family protein [Saccharicrinis sp. FJH54]|uniref:MliC family protein n=1 Tax=Saccharicrinis sp. FJH54 TaxID=3344665 RepID=UPI0035D405EB